MNLSELESESEINSEFNSQVIENNDILFCNKLELSSQSSNKEFSSMSSISNFSDLNSNNCENDFESDSKEQDNYILSNYSSNKLKKSKSIQKNNTNNYVYSPSDSDSFIYEKEFLFKKEDLSSSDSISENFDLEKIDVKNIFAEFFSNSSDFDSSDFEYEDNKKIFSNVNHIKSNDLNYLAENIAESISKIFINSPNEDLRNKALNISGASSCNELNEKIASQILNYLQVKQ